MPAYSTKTRGINVPRSPRYENQAQVVHPSIHPSIQRASERTLKNPLPHWQECVSRHQTDANPSQKDRTAQQTRRQHHHPAHQGRKCEFRSPQPARSAFRSRRRGGRRASRSGHGAGARRCGPSALGTRILRSSAREPNTRARTVLEEILRLRRDGRQPVAVHHPGRRLGRAGALLPVGLVATVAAGGLRGREGILEDVEVGLFGDGGGGLDVHEAELGLDGVAFLCVFVDEAAGVDGSHLIRVEGGDFAEFAVGLCAAKFGEAVWDWLVGGVPLKIKFRGRCGLQDGNGVVAEGLDLLLPC